MSTVQEAIKTLATASEYSLRHHVDEIDVVLSEVERLQVQSVNDSEANTAIRAERDEYKRLYSEATEQLFSQEQVIETMDNRDAALIQLLGDAHKLLDQFVPNIAHCFGVDYLLLNETMHTLSRFKPKVDCTEKVNS